MLQTKAIKINLPVGADVDEKEAKMILACQLYERGKITTGQAAKMVGISRREFIESMGKYGASLFHLTNEELESDINNAKHSII